MGEVENQVSMQLSEGLQFVTACLIGHYVRVQTKSILLRGMLKAASFDKDYGIVLYVASDNEIQEANIKIFLRDIAYISAENISLDFNKDAMLESHTKVNHSKVVKCVPQSSAGQSGEKTKAIEQHATSFASSTNTVPDQKGSHTYPLNSISQPMMPIMQPAQTDNSFQGVQINPHSIPTPVSYQTPHNYGVQWQYPNAGGQLVSYVPPPYPQVAQPIQGYVPPLYPQAAQPIQGYVPHQVQGYGHQPQYPPGSQNFDSPYQAPRGHQGPR